MHLPVISALERWGRRMKSSRSVSATWGPVSKEKKEERKKGGKLKKGLKAKESRTLPS